MKNEIIIGSDHGGFGLKEILIAYLQQKDLQVEDAGCFNAESVHYPAIAQKVVGAMLANRFQQGILICGTGIGMSIAANRYNGIRATLCHDHYTARMAREHNNSNILVLGGRVTGEEIAKDIVDVWLETGFQGGRHQTRVDMFDQRT